MPSLSKSTPERARAAGFVLLALVTGCGHRGATPDAASTDAAPSETSVRADAQSDDADRDDADIADAHPLPRNFTPPTQIVAVGTWVPVRRAPVRTSALAGYLRAGAVTRVTGMPQGIETCPVQPRYRTVGGWYQLEGGGYVCVGNKLVHPYPSTDLRPAQPALDAGMPYTYAAVTSNTIMYREPPTEEQLRVYERWRFRADAGPNLAPAVMTPTATPTAAAGSSDSTASAHAAGATATNTADPGSPSPTAQPEPAAPAPPEPTPRAEEHENTAERDHDRHHDHADSDDEHHHHRHHGGDDDENPPLADLGATPTGEIRLRDLSGTRGGPVVRRLLAGMFVALDRSLFIHDAHARFWHTQSGGWVRSSGLDPKESYRATFTGIHLDETHTLPMAFMINHSGWVYRLTPNNHGAVASHRVDWRAGVYLTNDPPVHIGNGDYYRTTDGFAVSAHSVRIAALRTPPEGAAADEKWIDVDLDAQTLTAYEGARPVFVTLVSTGRGPEEEMLTPEGHFRIRGKHVTTTMDGDVSGRGPYSIEDVPWTMYIVDQIALHGAFWHQMFGYRMSHGCVNLSPPDANWLFFWSEPTLPEGWHGIFAADEHPGSRVEVHHGDRPVVQGRRLP